VTDQIRQSLDQAGLKDVSVAQNREKGVVTLTGNVGSDDEKLQADTIARSIASGQIVSDEIGVRPAGDDSAGKVESDLDSGIDSNLKAALVQHKLNRDVSYSVKNGVVTLTGKVRSQSQRSQAEQLAGAVPNVKQVVNELDVKNQKATSSQ
jgi:hyperosmotically inducible periplasmic protein